MTKAQLEKRTRLFALRVIRLVESLPNTKTSAVVGHQLLRSGTSVGSNYRASCRSRSTAEFVSKLGIVEEEADESIYWIELLVDSGQIRGELVKDLIVEANEILAIIIASIKTTKQKQNPKSGLRNPKSV